MLQLAHLQALRGTPWFDELQLDHLAYDTWGQQIAAGEAPAGVFFVGPLYAYVLGGVFAVLGHNLFAVRLIQGFLCVATVALVARLGTRIFDARAGRAAALVMALYVPAIHYAGQIEKTTLSVFLTTAALVCFFERRWRWSLLSGVLLGLAALTRGNLLIFVPLGALVGAAVWKKGKRRKSAVPSWNPASLLRHYWEKRGLKLALAFVAGAIIAVAPATLHNFRASGEWVAVSANAGQNFFLGNHAGNDTGGYRPPAFVRPDPAYEEGDFKKEAERRAGRAMKPGELSAFWFGEGRNAVGAAPLEAIVRAGRKMRLFWNDYEVPDNGHIVVTSEDSPVLKLPVVRFGLLACLALLGAWSSFRKRDARLMVVFAGLYALTFAAFFVTSRFRAPIVPILAVLAPAGVSFAYRAFRESSFDRWVVPALLVGSAALVFPRPDWVKAESALAIAYHNQGMLHMKAGRQDAAVAAFERAIDTAPEAVVGAMRMVGDLHRKRGDLEAAERHMKRVVELKPQSRMGWSALAQLQADRLAKPTHRADAAVHQARIDALLRAGQSAAAREAAAEARLAGVTLSTELTTRLGSAPKAPASRGAAKRAQALYNEASKHRREGRHAEAIAKLKAGIAIGPYHENARYMLGRLIVEHGDPDEGIAYYESTVADDPKPQTSHYFWARLLAKAKRFDEAEKRFAKALEVDPAHEVSCNEWGLMLAKQGKHQEAVSKYRRAVAIHPEYVAAHNNLASSLEALGEADEAEKHRKLARDSPRQSKKQYLYWGRALVKAGRYEQAVPELRKAIQAQPDNPEPREWLAKALAATTASDVFDAEQRGALVERLREGGAHDVWFATTMSNAKSVALKEALATAFETAGWTVKGDKPAHFALKAGIYMFVADETAPSHVDAVGEALTAADLEVRVLTGYRGYYDERKTKDPTWKGFLLAPEQSFLVVIGPQT